VRQDAQGRSSQQIVGRDATVVQNPETGAIVTVHPTSAKTREKLLREQEQR
jgi:hypothetical protein